MGDIEQLARLDRAERERIVDDAVRSVLGLVRCALPEARDRPITSAAEAAARLLELPVVAAADVLDPADPRCSDGVTMTWPVAPDRRLAVRLLPSLEGTVLPHALGCLADALRSASAPTHLAFPGRPGVQDSGSAGQEPGDSRSAGVSSFVMSRASVVDLLHRMSTPLTAVMAYTTLLGDPATGPLNEEQRQFIEILERNAARLMQMINEFNAGLPWEQTTSRQEDQ